MKSTAIFDFLLKIFRNLSSSLYSLTYLSLFDSFLFLRRFSAFLKSLDNYFLRWFAYKSLLSRFSVLISYNMWSSNHFSISSRFPCFSGSRCFRVQVFRVRVQFLEVTIFNMCVAVKVTVLSFSCLLHSIGPLMSQPNQVESY